MITYLITLSLEKEIIVLEKSLKKRCRILYPKNYIRNLAYEAEVVILKRQKPTVFQSIVNKIALFG